MKTLLARRARLTSVAVLLTAISFCAPGVGLAKITPWTKCEVSKIKLVGKVAAQLLKCHAQAAKKGVATDQECLDKGATAFTEKIATYEEKSPCQWVGEADSSLSTVQLAVAAVVETLRPGSAASSCDSKRLLEAANKAGKLAMTYAALTQGEAEGSDTAKSIAKIGNLRTVLNAAYAKLDLKCIEGVSASSVFAGLHGMVGKAAHRGACTIVCPGQFDECFLADSAQECVASSGCTAWYSAGTCAGKQCTPGTRCTPPDDPCAIGFCAIDGECEVQQPSNCGAAGCDSSTGTCNYSPPSPPGTFECDPLKRNNCAYDETKCETARCVASGNGTTCQRAVCQGGGRCVNGSCEDKCLSTSDCHKGGTHLCEEATCGFQVNSEGQVICDDAPVNTCCFKPLTCADPDPCTNDACYDGACHNDPIQCPQGQSCQEGACVAPTPQPTNTPNPTPQPTGGPCTQQADCTNGEVCRLDNQTCGTPLGSVCADCSYFGSDSVRYRCIFAVADYRNVLSGCRSVCGESGYCMSWGAGCGIGAYSSGIGCGDYYTY